MNSSENPSTGSHSVGPTANTKRTHGDAPIGSHALLAPPARPRLPPILKSCPTSRASSRECSPRSGVSEAPSVATQAMARLAQYRGKSSSTCFLNHYYKHFYRPDITKRSLIVQPVHVPLRPITHSEQVSPLVTWSRFASRVSSLQPCLSSSTVPSPTLFCTFLRHLTLSAPLTVSPMWR